MTWLKLALIAVASTGVAVAQEATPPPSWSSFGAAVAVVDRAADTYGIRDQVVVTTWAHDFNIPFQGTEGPMDPISAGRRCISGTCGWLAGVKLPAGALIQAVELSGCDADPTQEVQYALFRAPKPASGPVSIVNASTGISQSPGCGTFLAFAASPVAVDNNNNAYVLDVLEGPGNNLQFVQVRVFYRLQVSPAPGTARFPNDVPTTHPFFRFVEALSASGVTGGCGAGSYCPDQPVTRGQMAVFLATALGLHFPN